MNEVKFYRVEFKSDPGSAHYFGSLSGIYSFFSEQEIGCKVSRLWAVKIRPGFPYVGSKCTISQEVLIRKKTKRGVK